ncbi:MAG: DUF1501 domain-containing protein, partial [Planctomycetaceae bacterium]|nr:DUF1501 domain-containing protein [Planctomycetaceae bacterium]
MGAGFAGLALTDLLNRDGFFGRHLHADQTINLNPLASKPAELPRGVRSCIFLMMNGAPSQVDTFDYKPELEKYNGRDCPSEYLEGQRFAFIQGTPKMLGPIYKFSQHGESGAWISDRLPHIAKHADELCFIKSMVTDQFNHGP